MKRRNFTGCVSSRENTARFAPWTIALLAILWLVGATAAQAQTATIFGSLSNFDVVNNTGHDAHGFEIQLEGLTEADIYYTFSAQRYGAPTVAPYATGVYVRWRGVFDASTGQFLQTTVPHAPNTNFAGTCYQWNGAGYATSGCEHFGVSLRANAAKTTYRWLIEDAQTPGLLTAVDPPVAIPSPTYVVLPPAQAAEPPVLEAEIEAPEPPEAPERFGDAQWVKVFKIELQREVTLNELVSDNAIVPQDPSQTEVSWEILQVSPPSNSNGNRNRTRRQNQGGIAPGTRAVVRRYEVYQYTGAYDPVTHEALCADLACNAPQGGELGEIVGAQMAAANVGVPSVTVTKSGNGSISSADKFISCGNKCSASYNQGTVVTLTASAGSGSVFAGWTGACTGSLSTCAIPVNEVLTVSALFVPVYNLSIGRSNSGTITGTPNGENGALISCGSNCSAKFRQGATVTLSAAPAAGLRFLNWTGACSGATPTCRLTITKDTTVQAVFGK